MPDLWSIGHGTRAIEDFLDALKAHRIQVLADIRHFPVSRRNPQFSQEPLREALGKAGLQYVHLVDLGGYRDGGYEVYMATPAWQAGFAALAALVEEARAAVMCAETVPWRCHRRFVAQHAVGLGWRVTHILDAERTLAGLAARQSRARPRVHEARRSCHLYPHVLSPTRPRTAVAARAEPWPLPRRAGRAGRRRVAARTAPPPLCGSQQLPETTSRRPQPTARSSNAKPAPAGRPYATCRSRRS